MKFLFSVLITLVCTTAYGQLNYTITGTLPDEEQNGKLIYLNEFDDYKGYIPIDSAIVQGKKFSFDGIADSTPQIGLLLFKEKSDNLPPVSFIIIEPGDITVEIKEISRVKGTTGNDEFQKFYEEQMNIVEELNEKQNDFDAYESLLNKLRNSTYSYLQKNMQTKVGEFFISDAYKLLDSEQVKELIKSGTPEFQNSEKAKYILNNLTYQKARIGDLYRDIELEAPDGKKLSLSDYVGDSDLILLDFWASWCGPCIKEAPTLVEAYKRYKDKGFEIVGISMDENKNSWTNAIKRLEMTWPQLSDLGGWKSNAAKLYNVNAIPYTLLLDKNGRVIAQNLRGEQLLNKLEELLK